MLMYALLLAVFLHQSLAAEVCYDDIGCFSNEPPFNNTMGILPLSPEEAGVLFKVYSRDEPFGYLIDYKDPSTISASTFDKTRKTKIVIHGFGDAVDAQWMLDTKNFLLIKEDLNVILVGWEQGASVPNYPQAVANTRVVGAVVAHLIGELEKLGASIDDFHLIGFSLGGQCVGQAGMRTEGRIPRISGLDPAGPLFEDQDVAVRLDETDGVYVDVIHTNGAELNLVTITGYGTMVRSGHVDIYVNGGEVQPGCSDAMGSPPPTETTSTGFTFGLPMPPMPSFFKRQMSAFTFDVAATAVCSHDRATKYFIESLGSRCPFTAYTCDNHEDFVAGKCNDCSNNKCNRLGFYNDPAKAQGVLFVDTNVEPPYCRG